MTAWKRGLSVMRTNSRLPRRHLDELVRYEADTTADSSDALASSPCGHVVQYISCLLRRWRKCGGRLAETPSHTRPKIPHDPRGTLGLLLRQGRPPTPSKFNGHKA